MDDQPRDFAARRFSRRKGIRHGRDERRPETGVHRKSNRPRFVLVAFRGRAARARTRVERSRERDA